MKKTVMKSAALVLALCMMLTVFASCGGASIVGKWHATVDGQAVIVELTEDGKAYSQGIYYADYTVDGDTLVMSKSGSDDKEVYTFKLDGDTMEMTSNGETVVCTRVK